MNSNLRLKDGFLGSLRGVALGDAIGELAFGAPSEPALSAAIASADTLRYTDDTAMTIGLAQALVERGDLEPEHLGATFRVNYDREPWRGYGAGPPTVFAFVKRDAMLYQEAAHLLYHGQGSYGNGAAMRVAPVGLFFYDAPDLYEKAATSASVTHAHPVGIDGAAIMAKAVALAVAAPEPGSLDPPQFVAELIRFARTSSVKAKMELLLSLVQREASPKEAADRIGRSVSVHESMPFALYAFLQHPHSFTDCILCAVLNGGDRDTLGAMAGGLSGAYLGANAIPPAWADRIENRQQITGLALSLLEVRSQSTRRRSRPAP